MVRPFPLMIFMNSLARDSTANVEGFEDGELKQSL